MALGRIPYAGPPVSSREYDETLLEMMQGKLRSDLGFGLEARRLRRDRSSVLADLPARIYESYIGVKDRQQAEADRVAAKERQGRLDEIAAERRAQEARTLAYDLGRQRAEDLEGRDESVIAESLGDMVRTVLPDPSAPGTPLYLPDIPLTDPQREERVGPRQLTPAEAAPQGKPLAHLYEIESPLEGQTETIPIQTAQEREREGYLAREEKIALETQAAERADARTLRLSELERKAEAAFEKENPDIDVVFFYETDEDGNRTRVAQDKNTLEVMGRWDAGVDYQHPSRLNRPSQASMVDQARFGFSRVLAGDDAGDFSYSTIKGLVSDPRHLEAKVEGYRAIDSPVYESYLAKRLSDNPEMKALTKERDSRFPSQLFGEKKEELEAFEQEVQQTYLDALDRYITGEGQGVVGASLDRQQGLYFIDPVTNKREPLSADLVSRLGLKHGEDFDLPSGDQVTAWSFGIPALMAPPK